MAAVPGLEDVYDSANSRGINQLNAAFLGRLVSSRLAQRTWNRTKNRTSYFRRWGEVAFPTARGEW